MYIWLQAMREYDDDDDDDECENFVCVQKFYPVKIAQAKLLS